MNRQIGKILRNIETRLPLFAQYDPLYNSSAKESAKICHSPLLGEGRKGIIATWGVQKCDVTAPNFLKIKIIQGEVKMAIFGVSTYK